MTGLYRIAMAKISKIRNRSESHHNISARKKSKTKLYRQPLKIFKEGVIIEVWLRDRSFEIDLSR